MDKFKVKFSPVKVIGEEKKVEDKRFLNDKEIFNDLLNKVEEFLLKPSIIDYFIYMESIIQVLVLLTAIFLSWLITRMGLSIAYVLMNICFFSLIYAFVGRILTKKYEMKMKTEAQKPSLNTNQESIEWLNFLLQKIWGTIEPVATEMVPDIVDGILKDKCPPFLHSIKLTKFSLGSEAPRIESVETFDMNLEKEEMQMIWHASFVPVTAEEIKYDNNKRTTEIQATAFVGNDKFQVPLNINVANLLFEGKVLLRIRFTHTYPFVKTASVSFMEPPKLSCTLKPLVGIDIMSIPGVQEIIDITVKTVLQEIAINPTTFDLDLENMLKPSSHDDPIGILKINIMEGRGLKNIGNFGNISDPYLKMNLGGNEIVRTKNVENDLNPFWNETKNLIIPLNVIRDSFTGSDNINFEVFDKNKTADKLMGRSENLKLSEFAMLIDELEEGSLNESNEENVNENGEKKEKNPTSSVVKSKKKLTPEDRERIIKQWGDPRTGEVTNIPLRLEGKNAGSINIQVSYHPVQKPGNASKAPESKEKPKSSEDVTKNNKAENTEQTSENENLNKFRSGVLRVHLYAMKDLEKKKGSKANPYAIVEINHKEIIKTEAKKRTNNPVFSVTNEIYVKNINTTTLKLTVKDKNSIGSDSVIGNLRFKVKSTMKYLLENPNDDWLEINDSPKGRVRFGFDWFPVKMVEENENSPAIGVCRIDIKNANNLKKVDTLGSSDPYTKLFVSGRSIGQTVVIYNNINPVWNETFYTIIRSRNDRVKFEVYGYNSINSDKKLGSVEYYIKDICDNISEEVGPTDEFKKMENLLPIVKKLEDGRFNVTSSLFENQQMNSRMPGEFIFEIQYYPISYSISKETESTEKFEEPKTGIEVEKDSPKISGRRMSDRGFRMFTVSKMGISSSELKNINENNVSGILRIKLEEAKNLRISNYTYTEFSFDNRPGDIFYRSSVIKSNAPVWDEIIEGFIMNIIHNKLLVNIRIRAKDSRPSDNDTSLLALQFKLNDIISNLNKSIWFTKIPELKEDENSLPAIKLAFGYSPIDMIVPPVDYLPNMGVLTVNVDDGEVVAMDSCGTSDPYIVFKLNGSEVYKTNEQKKTLRPIWNERFDVNINSRYNAHLEVEVRDWNKIEKHTVIGTGILALANLNRERGKQSSVTVDIFQKEVKRGYVNLILDFIPQRVYESKQNKEGSSESGVPAKVINNVAKGGINVAKGVVKAPTSVVSGIAKRLSKTFKGNKSKNYESKNEAQPVATSNDQQQPQNMTEEEASEINDGLGGMLPSKIPEASVVDKAAEDNVSVVSNNNPDSVLSGDESNSRKMSESGACESY